jgi:hypothetical protein
MKTYKTISILLGILGLFLIIFFISKNKNLEPIVENNITNISTTTITTTTNTTTASTTKPTVQTFPKNITLSISNSYTFLDKSILTIKQINDSRCATDIQCIWAGNVVVKFNIKNGVNNETFELAYPSNGAENLVYQYREYNIKISNVQPSKGVQSEKNESKDYMITLNISK